LYKTISFFFNLQYCSIFVNEPIKILHLTNVLNVNKTKQHNNSPNLDFPRSKYVIQQNSTNPILRSKLLFMEQNSYFLYNTNHYHFHKKTVTGEIWSCHPIHATISHSFNVYFNSFPPPTIRFLLRLSLFCGIKVAYFSVIAYRTFRDSPMIPSLRCAVRDCLLLNCASS
jgi:hypothetical protein